tara:strand:+ start:413 stop:640 length:228 start_codon:yes stop_codon:yes gene_type:complete
MVETTQQIIADLKAEQKGKKYPSKVKMLSVIWAVEGLTSVCSFEIIPVIRKWYDRVVEEQNLSAEFLKENFGIKQ